MLRRLKWMTIGAGLGAGGSWWARRQARRAAEALTPAVMGRRVVSGASRRVAAARHDARLARRATEARLRERLVEARLRERLGARTVPEGGRTTGQVSG